MSEGSPCLKGAAMTTTFNLRVWNILHRLANNQTPANVTQDKNAKKSNKPIQGDETYDVLFRDNIFNIILPIADDLLDIQVGSPVPFVTDIVRISKREPDYVGKFEDTDGEAGLLHMELQTTDDKKMVHRMREYQCLYEGRFEMPMYQYCIYLGEKPSKMATELKQRIPKARNNYSYKLIELRNYASRLFIDSDIPEMVLLAILGNFGKEKPDKVITAILNKLKLLAENNNLLSKFIKQLNTLSKLRNLQKETLQQIKAMPVHFDITKDVLYNQGVEKGIEQGISKGIEQGITKGIEQGITKGIEQERERQHHLQNEKGVVAMLKSGKLTTVEIAHLMEVTIEQVNAIKEKHNIS